MAKGCMPKVAKQPETCEGGSRCKSLYYGLEMSELGQAQVNYKPASAHYCVQLLLGQIRRFRMANGPCNGPLYVSIILHRDQHAEYVYMTFGTSRTAGLVLLHDGARDNVKPGMELLHLGSYTLQIPTSQHRHKVADAEESSQDHQLHRHLFELVNPSSSAFQGMENSQQPSCSLL